MADVIGAPDLAAIADEFFRCSAAGDADGMAALCAEGCRFTQNFAEEGGVEMLIGFIGGLAAAGITTSYSDIRRIVANDAVTEQHVVTLRRPDGVEVSADVCVVMRFDDDGLIVRGDEYADAGSFAAVFS